MPVKAGEKIIRFLLRQNREIREGRLSVLLRKVYKLLVMPVAVVVVLLVRILRPVVVIRFGPLISDSLGHLVGNTELYLCERDAGMHGYRTLDIFYHTSPVCNQQLKKMWNRTLPICQFAGALDLANRLLPGGATHVIPMPSDRDIYRLLKDARVHLSFTPEEERLGRVALRELGMPEEAPFVCVHSRDSAYLYAVFPNRNWRYHDHRDSNIKSFIPAAEELVRRGYFAVRTGAVVKEPLQTTNPMIIDYATKGRTEFLDIFLGAKCHFYLGDPSGIHAVPGVFRRPLALVNLIPINYIPTWSSNDLFIPKKLWLREEHRFLTFREIRSSGVWTSRRKERYEQHGIEVIENTPEEITTLAVEMDERLKGKWQTTEEDEELQQRFWSLFKLSELNRTLVSRIGAEFLRQNRELLD